MSRIGKMPIADEDVTIRRNHNISWTIKCIRTLGGNACFPERHENLSILIQLKHLLALAVFVLPIRDPNISIAIDGHSMSLQERQVSEAF